jgi:HlyD family secretion protein
MNMDRRLRLPRGWARHAAALLLVSLAACDKPESTAYQGYVEAEYVRVASPLSGTLLRLSVDRGAHVKPEDTLFVLEQEAEQAARLGAEQRMRQSEARLADLRKGRRPDEIAAIEAQRRQALAALELSRANLQRDEKLVAGGFLSEARLDETRSAFDRDQARLQELQAQLRVARLAARGDEIRAAEAEVNAARAAMAQAQWSLDQKAVRSPVGGIVQDRLFLPGEWVPAGSPVVSLLPPENLKLRFFVPQRDLPRLKVGGPVLARCDGCPQDIPATVSFISTQAEYTPPVIYSRESRAKLVFLVEAKVAPERAATLHPGQPVDVWLHYPENRAAGAHHPPRPLAGEG